MLTAGLGTRLDPITRLVAKPAVPLGGRTLIEYVLAWLSRNGVSDLVLNLHHRPESVAATVGDGHHLGLRVRYSWEQPVLGSAGGPRRALPLFSTDPILIVNGDTLCDFDVNDLLRAHAASDADVTLAVVPNPDKARYNGLRLGAAGEVLGSVPKGHHEDTWHFVGVQVARASVFAELPDGVPAETIHGIYRQIIERSPGRIRALPVSTSFIDVGTPAVYLAAAMTLAGKDPSNADGLAASVDRSAETLIWASAQVPADARLRRCIVAGDVRVPPAFKAENAVIVPASIAGPDDHVDRRDDVAVFPLR